MKYDAIVIGSGQAGVPLSFRFADIGWQVALIEKSYLGGTCINNGCTPTKTMVHRAQVTYYARNAARWGVRTSDVSADLAAIVTQKNKVVHSFRDGKQKQMMRRPNLHFYNGQARFVGVHQVLVGETLLESEKIFINTGGRARAPMIPGLDKIPYLTNENMMDLTALPEHLIVLGGGYIGLRVLEEEGLTFLLNARATRVEQEGDTIVVSVDRASGPSIVSGSHLLVAIGRRPNTDDLGLEKAGIETDQFGFIKVNARLETNVPGAWALGDVKGGPAFTHISYNDFQIVDANLTQGKNLTTDNRIVPYSVFTDPQLGGVGMTEKEARAKGYQLKIGRIPMSYVPRAIERDETAGLMKIIVDAATNRILGATVLATDGGELIHVLYTLMLGNLPYTLLKGAVYIHPTLAEGFFSLMEDVKPVN